MDKILKNFNLKIIPVILVVGLGLFLRIFNLSDAPPSLNWDEAAWGYNAYSISETGRDEYGKLLPIFTRSFDEYKSTLPLYLMIPTIHIFGLNEFGVRLPSAFLGGLTVLIIFLLVLETFKNYKIALFSSFVLAVEPWSVHLSRVYYDANEALFLLLLGLLLFIKSRSRPFFLPLSIFSFLLSMFTYNSNKIIIPIFMAIIFTLNKHVFLNAKKYLFVSSLILILGFTFFAYYVMIGHAFARASTTNIFPLWHGEKNPKMYYFASEIIGRFVGYFSPFNLFIREPLEPSTILAGNSVFHPFEFIPWIIGIGFLLSTFKKHKEIWVLVLISPLPAVFTWNWFQPGRVMSLFAVFSILIGIGLSRMPRYILLPFVIIYIMAIHYIFDSINVYSPYRDGGNYQPGFRETVPVVMKHFDSYDHIIIDTPHAQPYIFYLFYGKYDPIRYTRELDLEYIGTPRKHFDFGKFQFRKIDWDQDKNLKNTLFVGNDFDSDGKVVEEVRNRDGNIVNKLVESNGNEK